jgi:hypothetical protein
MTAPQVLFSTDLPRELIGTDAKQGPMYSFITFGECNWLGLNLDLVKVKEWVPGTLHVSQIKIKMDWAKINWRK